MVTLNKMPSEAKRFYEDRTAAVYRVTRLMSSSVMCEARLGNSGSVVQERACTAQIHPLACRK